MMVLHESSGRGAVRRKQVLFGVLGSLPILLVGAFGLQSLRREEVIAWHEAGEAARAAAPRLAAAVHAALFDVALPSRADLDAFERQPGPPAREPMSRLGPGVLAVFEAESFTYPEMSREPARPAFFDPTSLPGDLSAMWQQMTVLSATDGPPRATSRSWSALADRLADTSAGMVSRYRYARALVAEGRTPEAIPVLEAVVAGAGGQAGSTGLPLEVLALRTMVEVADAEGLARSKHGAWLDAYCQRVLLKWRLPRTLVQEWESGHREQVEAWLALADRHEAVREKLIPLLSSPATELGMPGPLRLERPLWVSDAGLPGVGLLTRHEAMNGNGVWYLLRSAIEIDGLVRGVVRRTGTPSDLALSISVFGRGLEGAETPAEPGTKEDWLATAEVPSGPAAAVTVRLRVDKPREFLVPVRRRVMGLAVFIALASLTSVFAVVMALRAWERQRRLAEMQSGFVASVTHELRAPLASVRLLAEELVDLGDGSPGRRENYLRLIVRETQRLGFLIENVLRHARLERGGDALESAEVDLREVLEQSVESLRPVAAERDVPLTLEVPANPVLVDVDAPAMQQVLVNLIDNALKHSPAGASVVVGLGDAAGGEARLWVEDHGAGIPREDQKHLFDAFYRRGTELRRETPGVGLGLTIVKRIVTAHGGEVTVESAPGAGARFEVRLPCRQPRDGE
ncbi:MAG: HAMP domain-containing histidine kinase [Verrucomicrobiales bacterium]|nr:HAMP domain-containing histidine kinase [Verrucomicrobiales bacterium]